MLKTLFGKILPFGLALAFGIFIGSFSQQGLIFGDLPKIEPPLFVSKEIPAKQGSGSSGGCDRGTERSCWPCKDSTFESDIPESSFADGNKDIEKVRILSKPKGVYTEAARENRIEGSVRLKVNLLASGQVGSITPVVRLPFGLTEQAITAARQLKFRPKTVKGSPVSTMVTIDYSFEIY